MQLETTTFPIYITMSDTWRYIYITTGLRHHDCRRSPDGKYRCQIISNNHVDSTMKNYTVTLFIFYQYKDWGLHVFCILYYNTGNWSSSTTRQIVSILFIHWNQITTLMMVTKIITTRTNRTPAFWDTPHRPMITHTSDSNQIPSQNKTKSKLHI